MPTEAKKFTSSAFIGSKRPDARWPDSSTRLHASWASEVPVFRWVFMQLRRESEWNMKRSRKMLFESCEGEKPTKNIVNDVDMQYRIESNISNHIFINIQPNTDLKIAKKNVRKLEFRGLPRRFHLNQQIWKIYYTFYRYRCCFFIIHYTKKVSTLLLTSADNGSLRSDRQSLYLQTNHSVNLPTISAFYWVFIYQYIAKKENALIIIPIKISPPKQREVERVFLTHQRTRNYSCFGYNRPHAAPTESHQIWLTQWTC